MRARHLNLFIIILITILSIVGCEDTYPPFTLDSSQMKVEKEHYKKEFFYKDPALNLIWDLKKGQFDNDPDEEILIVAGYGVRIVTLEGTIKDSFPIPYLREISAIDFNNDGDYEFLSEGGVWSSSVVVLNSSGKVEWKYSSTKWKYLSTLVGAPKAGDLDGDGTKEIVLPYSRCLILLHFGGGLMVFNEQGDYIHKYRGYPAPLEHIEIADFNGDGKDEILYWNKRKKRFIIQNAGGGITYQFKPFMEECNFAITDWVDTSLVHILLFGEDKMQVVQPDGTAVVTLDTPFSYAYCNPSSGNILKLKIDGKIVYRYVSTIVGRGSCHKTVLSINSLSGELLYQEIIWADCPSLLILSDSESENGGFLIGARDCVLKYSYQE